MIITKTKNVHVSVAKDLESKNYLILILASVKKTFIFTIDERNVNFETDDTYIDKYFD